MDCLIAWSVNIGTEGALSVYEGECDREFHGVVGGVLF